MDKRQAVLDLILQWSNGALNSNDMLDGIDRLYGKKAPVKKEATPKKKK